MMIRNVVFETSTLKKKMMPVVVSKVGLNVSPVGQRPLMTITSNRVGVIIPQGRWKVFVDPSKKKIEASNMQGFYLGLVLESWIRSKMPNFSHYACILLWTLFNHER